MELVNGGQFLNITFLLVLFTVAAVAAMFGTFIVFQTAVFQTAKHVCMHHYSHITSTISWKF